jgi:hypothetical protein
VTDTFDPRFSDLNNAHDALPTGRRRVFPIFRAHSHLQMHDVPVAVPYISCAAPEQSMHRWFFMDGRYSPTWRPTCRQENYSLFRSSRRLP